MTSARTSERATGFERPARPKVGELVILCNNVTLIYAERNTAVLFGDLLANNTDLAAERSPHGCSNQIGKYLNHRLVMHGRCDELAHRHRRTT